MTKRFVAIGDNLSNKTLYLDFTNISFVDILEDDVIFADNDNRIYTVSTFATGIGEVFEIYLKSSREGSPELIATVDSENHVETSFQSIELPDDFGALTEIYPDNSVFSCIKIEDQTHKKVYAFCENLCREETMTKEEILGSSTPTGMVSPFAGANAPLGWLICDGRAISRIDYADLFAVIGTNYGDGNGSTTFNIPDLKGRIPVGKDNNDLDLNTLGETGGEKTHILTIDEMPSHNHGIMWGNGDPGYAGVKRQNSAEVVTTSTSILKNSGGGQAHNNMQPYITLNYIIKA